MEGYTLVDSNPGSASSHQIHCRRGFDCAASLFVEKIGDEYHISHLSTKEAHRGQGLAKKMIEYVEKEYGRVVTESANDPFWGKMGFFLCEDGMWRKVF